jgi:hypothetical protein
VGNIQSEFRVFEMEARPVPRAPQPRPAARAAGARSGRVSGAAGGGGGQVLAGEAALETEIRQRGMRFTLDYSKALAPRAPQSAEQMNEIVGGLDRLVVLFVVVSRPPRAASFSLCDL